MFEIYVVDNYNVFGHFLEFVSPYFPMRNFQYQSFTTNLNISFKTQPGKQILNLYILQVNSFDSYKSVARSKVIQFIDSYPNGIILYFPSVNRVDEKVNKLFLQTYDIIAADLLQLKGFAKDRMPKLILYDQDKELNKENCTKEIINTIKTLVQLQVIKETNFVEEQTSELNQQIDDNGFSFYKLFMIKQQQAQIYEKLNLNQEALQIYFSFEDFFLSQYYKRNITIFNSMHPFDFLANKSIKQLIQLFDHSDDESQSTILDFLVLIEYKIIEILSITNQIQCFEKIMQFSKDAERIVEFHINRMKITNKFQEEEQILWRVGLLTWQFNHIQNNLSFMSQVPQNLSGQQYITFQFQLLKIRQILYQIGEQIGTALYQIDFAAIKQMNLDEQCKILELQFKGDKQQELEMLPNQQLQTFLLGSGIKNKINNIVNYTHFYNELLLDIISICNNLQLSKLKLDYELNLLRLKNVYPTLPFSQENIQQFVVQQFDCINYKNLYASILVQQLIFLHRNNMLKQFTSCFQEAMQSAIPGRCFTNLFTYLKLPLQKLKDVQYAYFDKFDLTNRESFYQYQYKFNIMKYLQIECDGIFIITLKAKGSGKDRKKLKIKSDDIKISEHKQQQFIINFTLTDEQKGYYYLHKVVLTTGNFKLYLTIANKLEQLRYSLIFPTIDIPNEITANNIGTIVNLTINNIPADIQEYHLEIISKEKLTYQIPNSNQISPSKFRIKNIDSPVQEVQLIVIGYQNNEQGLQIRVQIGLNDQIYFADSKIKIRKSIKVQKINYEDEGQLFEIQNLSTEDVIIHCNQEQTILKLDDIIRILQTTEQIKIQELEIIQTLDYLLEQEKALLDIGKIQSKQLIFKIQLITIFQQDEDIPYTPAQFFKIIIKLQYLGLDQEIYKISLLNHYVNGKRSIEEEFSKQKTIQVKDWKCFITGRNDFQKPQLQIFVGDQEVDPINLQVEYQTLIEQI